MQLAIASASHRYSGRMLVLLSMHDVSTGTAAYITANTHSRRTRAFPRLNQRRALSLGVCENRDGWLVAWGLCGSMLIRFSTVWLLPFTLL